MVLIHVVSNDVVIVPMVWKSFLWHTPSSIATPLGSLELQEHAELFNANGRSCQSMSSSFWLLLYDYCSLNVLYWTICICIFLSFCVYVYRFNVGIYISPISPLGMYDTCEVPTPFPLCMGVPIWLQDKVLSVYCRFRFIAEFCERPNRIALS